MERAEIETAARTAGRSSPPEVIVEWLNMHGFKGELIGTWVWLHPFDAKPDAGTLATIKAVGFRWSPKRGQWYHPCGHAMPKRGKRKPTAQHPRERYGSVPTWELEAAR